MVQEPIKAWSTIDADFDLRAARDSFSTDPRAPRPDGGQFVRGILAELTIVDHQVMVSQKYRWYMMILIDVW